MPGLTWAGRVAAFAALIGTLAVGAASAQTMIVGNDEKITWDENGKPVQHPPGKDTLSVVDISKPDAPVVTATIPLQNTIAGPPVNLAIHPSGEFALIANSMNAEPDGDKWKNVPDTRVFIVDLKQNPPQVLGTVETGKQPSGMAISPKGELALVTNRADGTISVLAIAGKNDVKVTDTVSVGAPADQVSAVAITPDGKRALAAKANANKIALLSIDGGKVTYDKRDLPVGVYPYNLGVTPDGKLALTADNGAGGGSDGNIDSVSVIDLEANPARVIDRVVVGDAPEGFAISPKGNLAVAILLQGSNSDPKAFYHHPGGAVVALKIDGKKVTKTGEVQVGGLPEGVVFSPDGSHLYVGNFIDQNVSVLKVDGDKLTDTGQKLKLPGHPASMRGGPQ
ncbi:MAG: beta-propeller fold lactonase family protein [Alphaproteobacteria bacterium]